MKIDFEFITKYGVFRDALHLPDDHGLTDDQINVLKSQRLSNWIAVIETPSIETPMDAPIEEQPPVEE